MKNKTTFLPYLVMILPPLFWAGNFIVGRAVSGQEAPLGLSYYRWLLATVLFFPFCFQALRSEWQIIKKHFFNISILAIIGITGFNSFAYIALQDTTATNATLLNSFIPIFILIISGLFLKESISKKQIWGVLISLLGVLIIVSQLNFTLFMNLKFNKGDLWMLVATLDWTLYSILLKYLRPKELSAVAFLGVIMIIGTVVLFLIYMLNPFSEFPLSWSKDNVLAVLYIAIFPSILAYLAWNYGMQKLGASLGGQFIHLMPFIGTLMAVVFLNEKIQLYHLLGGLCIALGLWLSLSKKQNSQIPQKIKSKYDNRP